jgi:hypothetical protein
MHGICQGAAKDAKVRPKIDIEECIVDSMAA